MLINRKDPVATKERGFVDKRSKVTYRIHPGTSHPCQYLKGDDVGVIREFVFAREKGRCWSCGAFYGPNYGHLRHITGGLGPQRCWCPENLGWGCPKCHLLVEHKRGPM